MSPPLRLIPTGQPPRAPFDWGAAVVVIVVAAAFAGLWLSCQ